MARYIDGNLVKRAAISAASAGNNTIVAAVSGKEIVVVQFGIVADAAVTVKFQSAAGGTDVTGAMSFAANGGIAPPYCEVGHFKTASGALLNMVLGGAVGVRGWIVYYEGNPVNP